MVLRDGVGAIRLATLRGHQRSRIEVVGEIARGIEHVDGELGRGEGDLGLLDRDVEDDVHAADAGRSRGVLIRVELEQQTVDQPRRQVGFADSGEVQDRDALDLAIGHGREHRRGPLDLECCVVPRRSQGEISHLANGDGFAFEGDPHAGAVEVTRTALSGRTEEQHAPAEQRLVPEAGTRFPGDVLGLDDTADSPAQHPGQSLERARRRRGTRAVNYQTGEQSPSHQPTPGLHAGQELGKKRLDAPGLLTSANRSKH
jgi:hypothetical protein